MRTAELISKNNEHIQDLEKKLKAKRLAKEQEIKKVTESYDKNLENLKINAEDQYVQLQKNNQDRLEIANKNFEEKLFEYRDNLQKAKKSIDQEHENIKEDHTVKVSDLKEQNLSKLSEINLGGVEKQEDLQSQFKISIDNLIQNLSVDRNELEAQSRSQLLNMTSAMNEKIDEEEKNFNFLYARNNRNHMYELAEQKNNFQNIIDSKNSSYKRIIGQKIQSQNDEINVLDKHHKDTIIQKNADFKVRYEKMVKEHDDILNELKKNFDHDLTKIVESTSAQKRIMASQSKDPFYRVDSLDPKIIENEKDVLISLPIAEYEKDNVMISANDRSVRISISRKYTDKFDDQNGNSNKTTRSEILSKDLTTKDLLNPRKITQKYENGVVHFRISKK